MRPEHWVVIFLSLLIFHFLTELNHVYGSWRGERITDELLKIATYWVLTFATVFMVDYFFFDQSYLSPGVMQGWLGLTLGTLCGYRVLLRSIMHSLRKAASTPATSPSPATVWSPSAWRTPSAPPPGWACASPVFYSDNQDTGEEGVPSPALNGGLDRLMQDVRSGQVDKVYITWAWPIRARSTGWSRS